jgi:uncharacterized protein
MGARATKKNEEYRQVSGNSELYSDFANSFFPHPNTGQVTRRRNVDSVKQSLRNLILTNKYERLRNPTFGGNIQRYLFEDANDITAYEIKSDIEYLVKEYEPRVKLIEVKVDPSPDNNAMSVFIRFGVFTFTEETSLDIELYRVR